MADNETIVDIIAEMETERPGLMNAPINTNNSYYARRLKAALKRERGNCAKLREVLKATLDLLWDIHNANRSPQSNQAYAVIRQIKAALAAPPRNCDLARDWMRDLYAHFQPPASVKREMSPEWVDAVMAFCRWLVAPATEQEGGDK